MFSVFTKSTSSGGQSIMYKASFFLPYPTYGKR